MIGQLNKAYEAVYCNGGCGGGVLSDVGFSPYTVTYERVNKANSSTETRSSARCLDCNPGCIAVICCSPILFPATAVTCGFTTAGGILGCLLSPFLYSGAAAMDCLGISCSMSKPDSESTELTKKK
jgi:hypothetical protein